MGKKTTLAPAAEEPHEIKERIPVWLYPSTLEVIDRAVARCGCKSRSELLERAAVFYAGYVSGEDACDYLPPALVKAMRGTIQNTEQHICRLLFKLAVELDMVMNVLASGMEIPEERLRSLRGHCVQNVKKTRGGISLDAAVDFQNGGSSE